MAEHKWSRKGRHNTSKCINCGCIRECVNEYYIYYLDSTINSEMPKCDRRFIVTFNVSVKSFADAILKTVNLPKKKKYN